MANTVSRRYSPRGGAYLGRGLVLGLLLAATAHAECFVEPDEHGVATVLNVTEIPSMAFMGCSELTEVIIGPDVKGIGNAAFERCQNLSAVTMGFDLAMSLTPDVFPSCIGFGLGVPNRSTVLNSEIFCIPCAGVAGNALVIEHGITEIGANAFSHCEEIVALELPMTLVAIGMNAFAGCSYLSNVNIPSHVAIGPNAFAGCRCDAAKFVAGAELCFCLSEPCTSMTTPATPVDTSKPLANWVVAVIVIAAMLPLLAMILVTVKKRKPKPPPRLFDGASTAVVSGASRDSVYEDEKPFLTTTGSIQ